MPNYFAPAFQVQVNGTELAADISKNIQQISVGLKRDMMDTFSFTIANAYPKLRWTHTGDSHLFQEGSSVRIALGYVDDLQEVISGDITKISPTFPDSGMPSLGISGYTLLHRLCGDKKTRPPFLKMTDKQIVEQIAGEVNLRTQVDETSVQYDSVVQKNQTDYEFLTQRAKLIQFELLVKDSTLLFRKPPDQAAKVYTLVWGESQAAFAGGPNMLPLKSFSTELNILNQYSQVTVRAYDPATKKAIVGKASQATQDPCMNGARTGPQIAAAAFGRSKELVRVNVPVASQAEADQHAQALYNEHAKQLLTGHGTTLGVPDLAPGNCVDLEGVGKRFSGYYRVTEATHAMGNSGYSTDFSVERNDA